MPTLLLVDDNEVLAGFTARILESSIATLKVVASRSCAQARNLATELRPQVVLLDRYLPDGDGLELLGELSASLGELRGIVVTADAPDEIRSKALAGGAQAVLEKPFEAEELISTVKQALGTFPDTEKEDESAIARPKKFTQYTQAIDRHLIINRLAGLMAGLRAFGADLRADANDPQAIERLIDEYLDRLVGVVQEISDLLTQLGETGAWEHERREEKGTAGR